MAIAMAFDPRAYGPVVAQVLGDGSRFMPLVAGGSSALAIPSILRGAKAEELFPNAARPAGVLAGLYTYLSQFDAAHAIAQEDHSIEGSYWHGILHRQEPDDWNAGYWFRKVGRKHPIFEPLAEVASAIAEGSPGCGLRVAGTGWDPLAFIEYCSAARSEPVDWVQHATAIAVQRIEWQLLFAYCATEATKDWTVF